MSFHKIKVICELQPDFSCNKMPVVHYSCIVLLLLSHIYVLELGKARIFLENTLCADFRKIGWFSNRTFNVSWQRCAQTKQLTWPIAERQIGHQKSSFLLSACFPHSVAKSAKYWKNIHIPWPLSREYNTDKTPTNLCTAHVHVFQIYGSAGFCMRRGEILSEKGSLILRPTKCGRRSELKLAIGHIGKGESPLTTQPSFPTPSPPKKQQLMATNPLRGPTNCQVVCRQLYWPRGLNNRNVCCKNFVFSSLQTCLCCELCNHKWR